MVSGVSEAFWQALDFQTIRQPSQNNLVGKWRPLKQMGHPTCCSHKRITTHSTDLLRIARSHRGNAMALHQSTLNDPKPRNLEPNREGMYPPKSRPRHSLVRSGPGRSFWSRGPSRGWLCHFARQPRNMHSTPGLMLKIGAGRPVMPGDSVWLCSTHPKPSPTTFRGWLAPIRQGRCDSAEIALKRQGAARNRRWTCGVVGSQNGRPPAAVGAQSRRAGPKSKKIGVRHGVLGPWALGVRNAGNVAPFNTGGTGVVPCVENRQKIKHQRLQCQRDQH